MRLKNERIIVKEGTRWRERERSFTARGHLRAKPRFVRVLQVYRYGDDREKVGVHFCNAASQGNRGWVTRQSLFLSRFEPLPTVTKSMRTLDQDLGVPLEKGERRVVAC